MEKENQIQKEKTNIRDVIFGIGAGLIIGKYILEDVKPRTVLILAIGLLVVGSFSYNNDNKK